MGMVDVDMESVAKRKSCEQRLKELDDEWKRKMNELLRDNNNKMQDVKKKLMELCKQRINEVKIAVRDDCNNFYRERFTKIRDNLLKADRQKSEKILKLRTEVARLKSENARLTEAVARTAAAMTLSGMPRKRRRPGFQDLGNPPMW